MLNCKVRAYLSLFRKIGKIWRGFVSVPAPNTTDHDDQAQLLGAMSASCGRHGGLTIFGYIIGACNQLFLLNTGELWLCANGRFRMHSDVVWRKELWLYANGRFRMCRGKCVTGRFSMCSGLPCAFLVLF